MSKTPSRRSTEPRPRTSNPLPTTIWFPGPDEPNAAPIPGAVLPARAIDKVRTEFVGRPDHRPAPLLKIAIRDTEPGMDACIPCTSFSAAADVKVTLLGPVPIPCTAFSAAADVKVTLLGPVPVRKGRSGCAVGARFKERRLLIPAEVPDKAWALIEPLVTKIGRGSGKSTDLPARDAVEVILWKARTGQTWNEAASRMTHGAGKSLMSRWTRWKADGTWERVMEELVGVQTIPAVPVPEPSKEPPLPDMLVEGVVEPRLFLTDDDDDVDGETPDGTVASSTTMSWQAAMTASAMQGRPSRRAAPGF